MPLPTVGEISYNGITFDPLVDSRISSRVVYDPAGRTVSYIAYTLTLEAYVSPGSYGGPGGDDTDGDMERIRRLLQAAGGQLVYSDKGFGDLSINTGNVRDVCWGPKPQLLEWLPVGSKRACKVRWQVEWHMPECSSASYQFRLMEWNYTWRVSIDADGLTTRTISGHIRIPQTRISQGNKTITDTADRYREALRYQIPTGYKREVQDFTDSPDRCRLDFTFVDRQLPTKNPYPIGASRIDLRQRLQSAGRLQFWKWRWSLSGSVTVAAGMNPGDAWQMFLVVFAERYRWVMQYLRATRGSAYTVIPCEASFEEEVFGLTSHFSLGFDLLVAPDGTRTLPRDLLIAAGMWKPIRGTNWAAWSASMVNAGPHHIRGQSQLRMTPSEDTIIDLCATGVAGAGADAAPNPNGTTLPVEESEDPRLGLFLFWWNTVYLMDESGRIYHVPLKKGQKVIEQVRHSPLQLALMVGFCDRIGRPSPVPELLRVNGKPVKRVGTGKVWSTIIRVYGGYPVVRTHWAILYRLETSMAPTSPGKPDEPIEAPIPPSPAGGPRTPETEIGIRRRVPSEYDPLKPPGSHEDVGGTLGGN